MSDAGSQVQATIGSEWVDDVLVLKPSGRVDSNNAGSAEAMILGQVDGGAQRLVFDMSELNYISSAGLRVLLVTAKRLRQTGGRMALCQLRPNVHEVLEVSGFLSILTVCDGRQAAIGEVTKA